MRPMLMGLALSFFCFTSQTHAKEPLTWMVLNWPPWMILEGADKGTGRFDHILQKAYESLPQYNHVTEKMNWARFWHEVETGTNTCYLFGLKNAHREEIAYFSNPHTFVLPNAVVMKKTTIEKLGNPGSFSIETLLKDKRFKGYAEKNRSFTKTIDNILKKHESSSSLTRVTESGESLIKMVMTGRIDYTIEYPIVAAYYEQKNGNPGIISSIPISEMDPFSYVYTACTRNAWGKKVIERWNDVLHRIKPTLEYRKITEIGHTDENELLRIRKYYEEFINAE